MVWRNIEPAHSLFYPENGGITVTEKFDTNLHDIKYT
jgi:hypothetical protein